MNEFCSRSVLASPIKKKKIIWLLWVLVVAHGLFNLQSSVAGSYGTRPPALGALGLSYRTIREVPVQYVLNSNSQPWYTIGYILLLLHLLLDILGLK